jgi:uncharacterized membrane protein YfcA
MNWLLFLFFSVATVYSMVGFAGGSSYIAILVLFKTPYQAIPPIALLCNLVVASVGSYHFIRAGHFSWKLLIPFLVTSVPMAYWGGKLHVNEQLFLQLLFISLAYAGLNLLVPLKGNHSQTNVPPSAKKPWLLGLPFGCLFGSMSGLVGIGGGIFLSPLLHLLRWGSSKEIAAWSAVFILMNSLAGLIGQLSKPIPWNSSQEYLWLPLVAFCGGMLGSSLGSQRLSSQALRQVTAILILYVAGRIGLKVF